MACLTLDCEYSLLICLTCLLPVSDPCRLYLFGDRTGRNRRAPSAARPNYALLEDDANISGEEEERDDDEESDASLPDGRAAAPSPNPRLGHSAAAAPKRPQRAAAAAAARATSEVDAATKSDSDFEPDSSPVRALI